MGGFERGQQGGQGKMQQFSTWFSILNFTESERCSSKIKAGKNQRIVARWWTWCKFESHLTLKKICTLYMNDLNLDSTWSTDLLVLQRTLWVKCAPWWHAWEASWQGWGTGGAIIRNHPYATTQRVHNTEFHKQPEDKYPRSSALQILFWHLLYLYIYQYPYPWH